MITTYITPAEYETAVGSDQYANYETSQIQQSVSMSFSMVNSYLSAGIKVPAISDDGSIPGVLKHCQQRFINYLLDYNSNSQRDENEKNFNQTVTLLKGIGLNELNISEVKDSVADIGWNLIDSNCTLGSMEIRGLCNLDTEYTLTCNLAGYAGTATFSVLRKDNTSQNGINTHFDWYSWNDNFNQFEYRFDGYFTLNQYIVIRGKSRKGNEFSGKGLSIVKIAI